MGTTWRSREAAEYPRHLAAFRRAFVELFGRRRGKKSMVRWKSGEEMFEWWLNEGDGASAAEPVFFE